MISILDYAMHEMSALTFQNDMKLAEIKHNWLESKNLPRKKKKATRKHLNLEWQIFSYAKEMFKDMGVIKPAKHNENTTGN
jgi:hypothetical protein